MLLCAALGLLVGAGFIVFFNRIFHVAFPLLARRIPAHISVGQATLHWNGVQLDNVSIRTLRDKNLATIARAHIALQPFNKWWDGQPARALGDIQLERPALTLDIDRDGRINWASLLRTSSTIGVEFVHHFRGRVQLEGGFLHIHDARDIGFLYELHQLHGTATFASGQPIQRSLPS